MSRLLERVELIPPNREMTDCATNEFSSPNSEKNAKRAKGVRKKKTGPPKREAKKVKKILIKDCLWIRKEPRGTEGKNLSPLSTERAVNSEAAVIDVFIAVRRTMLCLFSHQWVAKFVAQRP